MKKNSQLGLFDLTMIVVSLVIGMGIFRTPVNVAKEAGEPSMFFAAWIIGGFIALCGALTYAEIGSRYPVTGGYYKIFSTCYHPSVAFSINCIILISNAASMAGVALIGSEYLAPLLLQNASADELLYFKLGVSAAAILLFYGVNLLGLYLSAKFLNILTLVKIGMVLLLILPIFFCEWAAPVATQTASASNGNFFKTLGACLVAISFTYGGYQQTINFGGDVKNPSRRMPQGIFLGILLIMALYLSINFAYYAVIGFENLKSAQSIAAIMAGKLFGESGFTLLSLLLFLSVLAYVNVLLMSNPRVMYAMSEEGILPAVFKKKQAKTQVMTVALSSFAALGIITLFYAKTFDEILNYTIFLDSIGMAFSAATIFIFRKRKTGEEQKEMYTMGLYPWLPLLFIGTYVAIGLSIAINTPVAAGISLGIFAFFFVLYFLVKKSLSRTS